MRGFFYFLLELSAAVKIYKQILPNLWSSVSYTNSWHFTPQPDRASLAAHIWGKCKSPCLASIQTNHYAEIYYSLDSDTEGRVSADGTIVGIPIPAPFPNPIAFIYTSQTFFLAWERSRKKVHPHKCSYGGLGHSTVSGMSKTKTRQASILICALMWHEYIDTFLRVEEAEKVAPAVGAEGISVFILIIDLIKKEGFDFSFEHWPCVSFLDPELVPKNQDLPPWLVLETRETTRKPAFWERSTLFGWEELT